jgi:glyoxylase-like metal-dependent hydrolase (beta-lactamase superfamily II)
MEPSALVPVIEDVWRWSVWNEPRKLWFNGHVVRMGESAILVDPVALTEDVAESIDEVGARCSRWLCVITNADHSRAAAQARARFGAQIWVARGDAERDELTALAPDDTIDDGDQICGLRVVRVSDVKTPGEIVLYWAARRALFLGDAAIGRPAGALSMLAPEKFRDPAAARASVARLAELDVETILVGDGDDIVSGGKAALAALGA